MSREGDHQSSTDPLDEVILRPPIHGGCRWCPMRDECRLTPAGRLPCEGLSMNDLLMAQHRGQLGMVAWWLTRDELRAALDERGIEYVGN